MVGIRLRATAAGAKGDAKRLGGHRTPEHGRLESLSTGGDQDVIAHLARCSNGAFAGEAKMYMGHDELSKRQPF
jgi:hypothetical protein